MPTITTAQHPAFGRLVVLSGLTASPLRLTPQEATTVARALLAVRDGRSREREIYMSPIASDDDFTALVGPEGVSIGDHALDWTAVTTLAEGLLAGAK